MVLEVYHTICWPIQNFYSEFVFESSSDRQYFWLDRVWRYAFCRDVFRRYIKSKSRYHSDDVKSYFTLICRQFWKSCLLDSFRFWCVYFCSYRLYASDFTRCRFFVLVDCIWLFFWIFAEGYVFYAIFGFSEGSPAFYYDKLILLLELIGVTITKMITLLPRFFAIRSFSIASYFWNICSPAVLNTSLSMCLNRLGGSVSLAGSARGVCRCTLRLVCLASLRNEVCNRGLSVYSFY